MDNELVANLSRELSITIPTEVVIIDDVNSHAFLYHYVNGKDYALTLNQHKYSADSIHFTVDDLLIQSIKSYVSTIQFGDVEKIIIAITRWTFDSYISPTTYHLEKYGLISWGVLQIPRTQKLSPIKIILDKIKLTFD